MITIEISRKSGGYSVQWKTRDTTVFNAAKTAFKAIVCQHAARFDGESRAWVVAFSEHQALRRFIDFMAVNYEAGILDSCGFLDDYDAEDNAIDDAFYTLFLLPGAPVELVKSAYKILARLNHPDLGGDTEVMKKINAGYELIMKSLPEAKAA